MSLPITLCWHCDIALDDATGLKDSEGLKPFKGAISICIYCGAIGIFGDDLKLLPPTIKLLKKLEKDMDFKRLYIESMWARQYVMLNEKLMGVRDDPH